MKNLIYIGTVLLLLSSCGKEIVEYVTTFKKNFTNNSGHDMIIIFYKQNLINYISIANGATYTESYNSENKNNNLLSSADSVKIIYDNLKKKSWEVTDNDPRNLLKTYENHKLISQGERFYEYLFTFTLEDYKQAQPCLGNCN
jgi:hypothetical protein